MTWRPCWWCGQALHDDESEVCAEHADVLVVPDPDPTRDDLLRGFTNDGLAELAATFVEVHVEQVEHAAQAWAADHDLAEEERHLYVGTAAGGARRALPDLVHRDAQRHVVERKIRSKRRYDELVAMARRGHG